MMPVGRAGGAVQVRAPAKINLRLRILAREDSGYHQIETLFCAIDLADTLEIRPGPPGIDLDVTGAELGPPEKNLVYRAAAAFFHTAGIDPAVRILLEKRIPAGAGLGGGSSDAAAALRGLNEFFDRPLGSANLLNIGAALGSDVPFFLGGSPLALAWGRGERLLALPPLPVAPTLVVVPAFSIATAEAYRDLHHYRMETAAATAPAVFVPADLGSWTGVIPLAGNDFEPPTFARHPELGDLKAALHHAGATIALLSGSGSALFGIFADEGTRTTAATRLRAHPAGPRCLAVSTLGA